MSRVVRDGAGTADRPPLKTVDECLDLLLLIARAGGEWTPSRAARELGLPKTNAHRLMAALSRRGFLTKDPATRRYRLGLSAWMLGQAAQQEMSFAGVRATLSRLAAETGESAFFSVPEGRVAVTVEKVESRRYPVRLTMEVGSAAPLHAGASHRVILAFLPEAEREAYLAGRLEACTERTVTDPERLRAVLEEIRERGYDFSQGEFTPGVAAVAVPVFGPSGQVVASVSVGGPSERFAPQVVLGLAERLRRAAREIEASAS